MTTGCERLIVELARRIEFRNTLSYTHMGAKVQAVSETYTEQLKGKLLVALKSRGTKEVQ